MIALAILFWLAIDSFLKTRNFVQSSRMVTHSFDVLYNTERLMTNIITIESSQRGYAITGNVELLQPYKISKEQVNINLVNLLSLTKDNPSQHERITLLKAHIKELLAFSSTAVNLRKQSFEAAQEANASMQGKRLLDNIRQIAGEIEAEENMLRKQRISMQNNYIEKFNYTFAGLLFATGVILVAVYAALNITLERRVTAGRKLQLLTAETTDLYDNAPCGYHSLDARGYFVNINNTLLHWLGYTRDEMLGKMHQAQIISVEDQIRFQAAFDELKSNGTVSDFELTLVRKNGSRFPVLVKATAIKDTNGNFIKSRFATFDLSERKKAEEKIQSLNHELEAFTYSVSHDLRAPLRSIDGYAKILQEDYLHMFDEEGKRVINVIMNNAKRMGRLIDNLLNFSRLGRKEILYMQTNMTQLVKNIVDELRAHEPDRKIEVQVNHLHAATVDPEMIRQVWENLLSNAMKYTSKKSQTQIEVNTFDTPTEVGYCVKDNGVGFDMKYVGKLFGVFQRLHKIQDFSGAGVGLAIVKRIIDRHEGRVWAEGKVDGGAVFYFTIPKQ